MDTTTRVAQAGDARATPAEAMTSAVSAATAATARTAASAKGVPGGRTDFIDRLRVVITALVIAHHTAITYGGSGGWFYREITDGGTPSSLRWRRWGGQAYGAFVLHAPIVVAISVALRPWPAPALLKFAVVASAGIGLSFLAARAIRALPGVRRVL